jgi:orotate phosphoribosyltransferase-like protein
MTTMMDEQIADAVTLYESGLSLAQIGTRLGFDNNTVRLRLIERGVRMRDSHGRVRNDDAQLRDTHQRS